MNPEKQMILDELDKLKTMGDFENFLNEYPEVLLYRITYDLNNPENTTWKDYKQIIRGEKIKKLNARNYRKK